MDGLKNSLLRLMFIGLCAVGVLGLWGCEETGPESARGENVKQKRLSRNGEAWVPREMGQKSLKGVSEKEVITLGFQDFQKRANDASLRARYQTMVRRLEALTGYEIKLIILEDYQEMNEFISDGKLDVASLSPTNYILASRRNPKLIPIATELNWSPDKKHMIDGYMGFILVRDDRKDLKSLEDLRGRSFGFVSKSSSSGFQYPNSVFVSQGIDYEKYFDRHFFLGNHVRVTDAIASGSVDAGATWDYNRNAAEAKHGIKLRSLQSFGPIPNDCVVVHPKVDHVKVRKIQEAFLKLKPEDMEDLNAVGYTVKKDSFYDFLRQVIDQNRGAK